MPYRRSSLRPVNSEKHEINWSLLALDASSDVRTVIVQGVEPSAKNIPTEVTIGATVRTVYFEFHFSAETITNAKVIHWIIAKEPFGSAVGSPTSYNTPSRRFILKRGMEMLPKDVGTVFKRIVVVRIPPRIRRFGEDDTLVFEFRCSSTETVNACGIAIYKSFK